MKGFFTKCFMCTLWKSVVGLEIFFFFPYKYRKDNMVHLFGPFVHFKVKIKKIYKKNY
jgi:hypothetical protein